MAKRAVTGRAVNGSFLLPAGADNHEVKASRRAPADVELHSLMPHMHVRGKAFRYTLVMLLDIPKYDFGWQLNYQLAEPLILPKGAQIDCVAHYDNSPNNKANPDPAKDVGWGDQTWEEMMIGWVDYTVPVTAVRASVQ